MPQDAILTPPQKNLIITRSGVEGIVLPHTHGASSHSSLRHSVKVRIEADPYPQRLVRRPSPTALGRAPVP
eukprot:310430-Prymnesium_polylepis.1